MFLVTLFFLFHLNFINLSIQYYITSHVLYFRLEWFWGYDCVAKDLRKRLWFYNLIKLLMDCYIITTKYLVWTHNQLSFKEKIFFWTDLIPVYTRFLPRRCYISLYCKCWRPASGKATLLQMIRLASIMFYFNLAMVVKVFTQKRSYTWSRLIKTKYLWDLPQKIVWQLNNDRKSL